MNDQAKAMRLFAAEGSVHCYSNDPFMLSPADLIQADSDPEMRDALAGCNIYVVACRRRILISPEVSFDGKRLSGRFEVMRDDGVAHVPFEFALSPGLALPLEGSRGRVTPSGTHVQLTDDSGGTKYLIGASQIVSGASAALTEADRDLHVVYVGQSQGRKRPRMALDRLRRHQTLQAILAEFHTFHPEMELLLLLYQFGSWRKFISSAGDLSLVPSATQDEDRDHLGRIMGAQVSRSDRISLVEAALINHFKPHYNTVFKHTDFQRNAKKLKTLRSVLDTGLAGVIVEIATANINSRLYSGAQPASNSVYETAMHLRELYERAPRGPDSDDAEALEQVHRMARTHIVNFALTTESERETFMHGTRWLDAEERAPFI